MTGNVPARVTRDQAIALKAPALPGSAGKTELVSVAQKAARKLTAPQRAAVVIALLGPEKAGSVIEQIGDQHLKRFVTAYEKIKSIPREVLLAIVAEFITELKQGEGSIRGGVKEARALAEEILDEDRVERIFGIATLSTEDEREGDNVWTRLRTADPQKLAEYMQTQRPQLVGIIISQMPPDNAGVVLADLPDELSQYVVRSLANPVEIDKQTLRTIGQVVEQEFLTSVDGNKEEKDPLSAVSSILSVLPSEKRENLMEYLFEKDADQAEKIRKGLVTFEDIPDQLPRNAVPIIFREMDQDQLIKALKFGEESAPGSLEYLYSNISQRMAEQYKEQVEEIKSLSKKDGEAAQSAMMTLISSLDQAGTIKLIKVVESDEE